MDLDTLRAQIDAQCRGWSGDRHWAWQRTLFTQVPYLRRVCMLGVYDGRDTAYAAALLAALRKDGFSIAGVDLFSDAPCADWPEEKRGLSWEEAGFGPAPVLEHVAGNLRALGLDEYVTLHRQDAVAFLTETGAEFDLIYIDTSHDYKSTRDTIQAALPRLHDQGILAGDDFSNQATWGVKQAVEEACPTVRVFADWIWYAPKNEFYR